MLNFDDGLSLDTTGELRVELCYDGYYVVGNGMSIPVKDHDEGVKVIATLKGIAEDE